jgi:hypothetical protein
MMADIPEWEPRVRVLEEIASATRQTLADIRTEMRQSFADLRTDIRDMRNDIGSLRQRQERDFRLLFGAIIVVALGLAGLIARTQHWI